MQTRESWRPREAGQSEGGGMLEVEPWDGWKLSVGCKSNPTVEAWVAGISNLVEKDCGKGFIQGHRAVAVGDGLQVACTVRYSQVHVHFCRVEILQDKNLFCAFLY